MEDEERQKKLEAGKAKVGETEAAGPAEGGGGRAGVGGRLGSRVGGGGSPGYARGSAPAPAFAARRKSPARLPRWPDFGME